MLAFRLIEKKRDGGRLAASEWKALADGVLDGTIADYQTSAFLMAAFLNGLDRDETSALTEVMLASGATLGADTDRPRIDKHSTGGVGDKVSLVLAPLVASLGVQVPMISGRGLGHTGGTLDKLESIAGFRTRISIDEMRQQLDSIGCILAGQTSDIAPLDRKLYSLRDATATIESIPLIAASIMSKKLAEGLTGLVLDVKRGSGAFLGQLDSVLALARLMIELGAARGCPVTALVTAMDRPLGRACGNALEVEEAIHALEGEGPPDLLKVTYALGAEMLVLAERADDRDHAMRMMEVAISSGRAMDKFREIVAAQGGEVRVVDDPSLLPQAAECELWPSPRDGVVAAIEPRAIGRGVIALGGGRSRVEDGIDHSVGFVISARPGDVVRRGEPLATIFARDKTGIAAGAAALGTAITVSDEAEPPLPLVSHRVTSAGVEAVADF
ncbi:MAG: thymidine phosphorylase [Gemmatimonadota bacterium]